MIYIYDILLNFSDCNLVYDFYEWDKKDNIENYKKIYLVRVDSDTFNKILNYNFIIDKNFLINIYNTAEIYLKNKTKIASYVCLFSDGYNTIGVEFNESGESIYKSKLLLDELDEINVLALNMELSNINIKLINKINTRFIIRKDIVIYKYLYKEIIDAYNNKLYSKIKYLYKEYFDKTIKSYKKMKDELLDSIKYINEHNIEIYNLLKKNNLNKQV